MNKIENVYKCYFWWGIKGLNEEIFDIDEEDGCVELVTGWPHLGKLCTAQQIIEQLTKKEKINEHI